MKKDLPDVSTTLDPDWRVHLHTLTYIIIVRLLVEQALRKFRNWKLAKSDSCKFAI